jgi:hypothetical protein
MDAIEEVREKYSNLVQNIYLDKSIHGCQNMNLTLKK